jgi:hypothetical protein
MLVGDTSKAVVMPHTALLEYGGWFHRSPRVLNPHQNFQKQKQKNKFSRLKNTQHPTHTIDENKVVINLSNKELDPAASEILAKGLNFAHTTNPTSNIRHIISGVERAVMGLSTEAA